MISTKAVPHEARGGTIYNMLLWGDSTQWIPPCGFVLHSVCATSTGLHLYHRTLTFRRKFVLSMANFKFTDRGSNLRGLSI